MKTADSETLSAFVDGELGQDEVRERLDTDPDGMTAAARLGAVDDLVRIRCEPDPGFVIRHRYRREALSSVSGWTFRELGFRLTVATLFALALALLFALPGRERSEPPITAFESEAFAPPALPGFDPDAVEPVLRIVMGGAPGDLPGGIDDDR